MDLFFANPDDVPVPPEKMEIRELQAIPYPDGKRVAVEFEITPFQKRPNIELVVLNQNKQMVATLSVVEAIENKMAFTLHLRESTPQGEYKVKMDLFYTDLESLDEDEDTLIKDIIMDSKSIMASGETSFQIKEQD